MIDWMFRGKHNHTPFKSVSVFWCMSVLMDMRGLEGTVWREASPGASPGAADEEEAPGPAGGALVSARKERLRPGTGPGLAGPGSDSARCWKFGAASAAVGDAESVGSEPARVKNPPVDDTGGPPGGCCKWSWS